MAGNWGLDHWSKNTDNLSLLQTASQLKKTNFELLGGFFTYLEKTHMGNPVDLSSTQHQIFNGSSSC